MIIGLLTHLGYKCLHLASQAKNVRDVVTLHPTRIVSRLLKSKAHQALRKLWK